MRESWAGEKDHTGLAVKQAAKIDYSRGCVHVANMQQASEIELVVNAMWDAEASAWVATSDDVPGLATESASFESLLE